MKFHEVLTAALEHAPKGWFYERKHGGAIVGPGATGETWSLDRLWRLVEPTEPLAAYYQRIKLHRMRPRQWGGVGIPMHRHAPGAVVIGVSSVDSTRRHSPSRYVHTVADRDGVVLSEQLLDFPFVYKLERGAQHSIRFAGPPERWPAEVSTITLIPREGDPFESWAPSPDDWSDIDDSAVCDWAWRIVERYGERVEVRRMIDP